jgi:hypothetical protein
MVLIVVSWKEEQGERVEDLMNEKEALLEKEIAGVYRTPFQIHDIIKKRIVLLYTCTHLVFWRLEIAQEEGYSWFTAKLYKYKF